MQKDTQTEAWLASHLTQELGALNEMSLILKDMEDELVAAAFYMLEFIVNELVGTNSLQIEKEQLKQKLSFDFGEVTDMNFRKRISQINSVSCKNKLGFELKNTKRVLFLKFDMDVIADRINKRTRHQLVSFMQTVRVDNSKIVTAMAVAG